MPYITPEARRCPMPDTTARGVGDLTYILYQQCVDALPDEPCFSDYNALLGCLEATKLELYRRHIAPYEDKKREENGDVY